MPALLMDMICPRGCGEMVVVDRVGILLVWKCPGCSYTETKEAGRG